MVTSTGPVPGRLIASIVGRMIVPAGISSLATTLLRTADRFLISSAVGRLIPSPKALSTARMRLTSLASSSVYVSLDMLPRGSFGSQCPYPVRIRWYAMTIACGVPLTDPAAVAPGSQRACRSALSKFDEHPPPPTQIR